MIEEITARLPVIEPSRRAVQEGSEESGEGADGQEAEVAEPVEEAPRLHPAIDVTRVFEAAAFQDVSARMRALDLDVKDILGGEESLLTVHDGEDDAEGKPVSGIFELFDVIKKHGQQGIYVQRYKGLGEMNADELWATTMDPQFRKMILVTMEDAFQAERMFTLLMGDNVEPRRAYIEKYAATVKDLDI
jgi:DNA gyrase subunit B